MGRPSKLTPDQWRQIEKRVAAGEVVRALAREFGVSEAAIRQRGISARTSQVRSVAEKLAAAQTELAMLPVPQQHLAIQLADELREISQHLAAAARYGSATAHRLAAVAHAQVQALDDAEPLSDASVTALKGVSALTRLANDAAQVGLTLLRANEDTIKEHNERARQQSTRVTRIEIVPMQPE
jgi:ABC-type transporter Mla subunit MlaD